MRLATIINGQRTTEGLTRHRHGLVNLERDGRANAVAALLGLLDKQVALCIPHVLTRRVAQLMRLLLGLLNPLEVFLDSRVGNHVVVSRIGGQEVIGIMQTLDESSHHGICDIFWLDGFQRLDAALSVLSGNSFQDIIHFSIRCVIEPNRIAKDLNIVTQETCHHLQLYSRHLAETSHVRGLFASRCTAHRLRYAAADSTRSPEESTLWRISETTPVERQQAVEYINACTDGAKHSSCTKTDTCSSRHNGSSLKRTA